MKEQTHIHLRCQIGSIWYNFIISFIKTKKIKKEDGGAKLCIYLHIMTLISVEFFSFWHISRIWKTLLSSSAVRHRESLGYVSFFPLMSLGLNPCCCLLIYCSDMLIDSYANKETIRLLIISLHSSNRYREQLCSYLKLPLSLLLTELWF